MADQAVKLIFLPGASGSTAFWKPVQSHFESEYDTHIIAYPSFGEYPDHPHVNSMSDLQDYVFDHLQRPSILIAQSMGGVIAVQAALKYPKLIQGLVLVATSGGVDLTPFHVKDWRAEYQNEYEVPHWFIDDQTQLDERLAEIECPVLLIWGGDDDISPVAVGEYLNHAFQYSELKVIPNGQHDLAKVYAPECISFIQRYLAKF